MGLLTMHRNHVTCVDIFICIICCPSMGLDFPCHAFLEVEYDLDCMCVCPKFFVANIGPRQTLGVLELNLYPC